MHRLLGATALVMIVIAAAAVELAAQGADPIIGTWELNVAKSKYTPGPAPKSETRTYVVAGQDIKASSEGVDGTGKPTAASWTVNYDGKDHPETGNPNAETRSARLSTTSKSLRSANGGCCRAIWDGWSATLKVSPPIVRGLK